MTSISPTLREVLLRLRIGVADRLSKDLISAGFRSGFMASSSAIAPLTCEVAIEVPLISWYFPLIHADTILSPGA